VVVVALHPATAIGADEQATQGVGAWSAGAAHALGGGAAAALAGVAGVGQDGFDGAFGPGDAVAVLVAGAVAGKVSAGGKGVACGGC